MAGSLDRSPRRTRPAPGDHLHGTGSKYIASYFRPETRQVDTDARHEERRTEQAPPIESGG
ncbi:MAG: hypothetical protein J0H43_16490 [Actinobacteria bacterium]|nr:hypothetical protein [Actinomycetota bacterium]